MLKYLDNQDSLHLKLSKLQQKQQTLEKKQTKVLSRLNLITFEDAINLENYQ